MSGRDLDMDLYAGNIGKGRCNRCGLYTLAKGWGCGEYEGGETGFW